MIGDNIKKFRKEKNLKQEELGLLLGVSAAMISQWERGERNPKEDTLQKIADALGVPTIKGREFCKDKKEKMPENGEFNFCFSIEDNELWAYDAYMDGGAAIKINYCPMCGKKLVE